MYGHPAASRPDIRTAAARSGEGAPAIAVCALEVRPGQSRVRVFPAGRFDAPRGALSGSGPWFIDAALAAQVIARVAARSTDIPVDYEHQILLAEQNGQPAPAAGWIERASLEWVADGDEPGLYATVRWTPRAAGWIEDGSYRYLSPVFPYARDSGAVLGLYHVALTNTPAIDTELVTAAAARRAPDFHANGGHAPAIPQETPAVNETLKKLLAALGLPETTTESDAIAGVAALKAKADEAQEEIAALKAASPEPDPAKYVPVETMTALKNEVAALTARINGSEVAQLVEGALDDGRLLLAQKEWAEGLGKKDIAALRQYLDTAQPIAALKGGQTGGRAPAGAGAESQTTEADLAVCKALGLTPEEFAKGKQEGR
ncbi:phage protease [Pseudazoarcus pumilus]|uniref:Protease (I) and scaffold (Z) protein n=1 Tax=Pseudazoarcus pumilus TaxID=2067960 RepID=A0A2I6S9E9_9RHOO|nr:phage protease [Pseudazoarcus pumilus]AUN95878.1 protease (I) and scaffold (Z) protein [Pseudazoarcus pumilus]